MGFWSVGQVFSQGSGFKETSLLTTGQIHKVSVSRSGVYKIDFNFLRDKLKIDPATVDPSKIIIAGNGGGRIPQWNSAARIDDLEQSSTQAFGLDDGQFNPGDYLLWFAEGPDKWKYDTTSRTYVMDKNIYDDHNHYFIIINGPVRTSIPSRDNGTQSDYTSNASLNYQRFEEEKVNLLGRYRPPGSGQEWYGDEMAVEDHLDYTNRFDLTDFIPTDTVQFFTRFAVRNGGVTRFYVNFDAKEFSKNVGGVSLGSFEASYANDGTLSGNFVPGKSINSILLRYPSAAGLDAKAWVDYLQLSFWKKNSYHTGSQLQVLDPRARFLGTPAYVIENFPAAGLIWDVTQPLQPVIQHYQQSTGTFIHSQESDMPSTFICFNPATDVLVPDYESTIEHQNLHSIHRADLVIIYHDDFKDAALALAAHRKDFSHLEVEAIPISQLINEFGGGSHDPAAIRDFARMLHKRDAAFKYLLLVGDATYDFLGQSTEIPYQNFISAYETEESLDPIRSFPSDDFFALLDDDEGRNLIGALDIAVGRFPVSTAQEATDIVNKIIYYDTNPLTLGDWRNRIVMVADDEDSNVHLSQADNLAVQFNLKHPEFNQQKIYLDAYPQQSTPGGDRYPGANADIDLNMQKGALTVTYLGHGGPNGWTQERVLGINQAQSYDNLENMPLFITATCSFAGYDEPGFTSAGEHLLSNPNGGAIGLMTTVRAVFSGSNERLTDEVLRILYDKDADGNFSGVGEILRKSKNANAIDTLDNNARKFTLLGDPSMKLAIPEYKVVVTELQEVNIDPLNPDTLSALEAAEVSGIIQDHQGSLLSSFNGDINVTVFDKPQIRRTLANDAASSERLFTTQTRQLFKGTASVVNGAWTISFVLPKDIDFSYGKAKMSFYAEDGETDASGYFTDFLVGGVSQEGLSDDTPPVIKLYMNDDHFLDGGITDANPDIYAVLSDDHGINASGTSVGHDIEAVLDGDDVHSFILNDFYQAALNDPSRGTVRFPLNGLAPGRHTISLTAWDLANNAAAAEIEFVVVDQEGALVTNLQNNPNPVNHSTFFAFEHNRAGTVMDLDIDIFAMDGRLIHTIHKEDYLTDGYRVNDIEWKADNQQGSEVPAGMYMYRVRASFTVNGNVEVAETKANKLVIVH